MGKGRMETGNRRKENDFRFHLQKWLDKIRPIREIRE